MRIALHAGHNPDGMVACGAVGYIKESTCNREIVKELVPMLYGAGYEVRDLTVNDGKNQKDVLNKLCANTNAYNPDISVSIHCNSSANPSAKGVEAYYWTGDMEMCTLCSNILSHLGDAGYKIRRSIPTKSLKVINSIKANSILIECGFVSNKEDAERYNPREIARRICNGIVNTYGGIEANKPPVKEEGTVGYSLQLGYFVERENVERFAEEIRAKGYDCVIKEVKK